MNKYIITAIISLSLTACVITYDPQPDFENNRCVIANTSYQFNYLEVSGNCGYIPSTVVIVPQSGIVFVNNSCNNDFSSYTEGCSSHIDTSCYVNDGVIGTLGGVNYTHLLEQGSINYSGNGSYAYGKVSITLSSYGRGVCHSVYNVMANRL